MVDIWLICGWYVVDMWLIRGWYRVDIYRDICFIDVGDSYNPPFRKETWYRYGNYGMGRYYMTLYYICFYRVDLIQQPANSQFLADCPPWKRLWNLPLYDYLESGTNRRHGMKCLKSSKQFTLGIGWNWWKHRKTRAPVFVSWIKPIREEKTPRERKHTPLRKQIATPFLVLWIQDHGPQKHFPPAGRLQGFPDLGEKVNNFFPACFNQKKQ